MKKRKIKGPVKTFDGEICQLNIHPINLVEIRLESE